MYSTALLMPSPSTLLLYCPSTLLHFYSTALLLYCTSTLLYLYSTVLVFCCTCTLLHLHSTGLVFYDLCTLLHNYLHHLSLTFLVILGMCALLHIWHKSRIGEILNPCHNFKVSRPSQNGLCVEVTLLSQVTNVGCSPKTFFILADSNWMPR